MLANVNCAHCLSTILGPVVWIKYGQYVCGACFHKESPREVFFRVLNMQRTGDEPV